MNVAETVASYVPKLLGNICELEMRVTPACPTDSVVLNVKTFWPPGVGFDRVEELLNAALIIGDTSQSRALVMPGWKVLAAFSVGGR